MQITRNTVSFEHMSALPSIMSVIRTYLKEGIVSHVWGNFGELLHTCSYFSLLIFYLQKSLVLCYYSGITSNSGAGF